jgi:hypothetical protein
MVEQGIVLTLDSFSSQQEEEKGTQTAHAQDRQGQIFKLQLDGNGHGIDENVQEYKDSDVGNDCERVSR